MIEKRKGSRLISVNGIDFAWYRGKSSTEIRHLETNKAIYVNNSEVEADWCDLCRGPITSCGTTLGVPATFPALIRAYIIKNFARVAPNGQSKTL